MGQKNYLAWAVKMKNGRFRSFYQETLTFTAKHRAEYHALPRRDKVVRVRVSITEVEK